MTSLSIAYVATAAVCTVVGNEPTLALQWQIAKRHRVGVRWMDLKATLAWQSDFTEGEGTAEAKGSGPLPYLYFEYRRLFSEHWRFLTGLGLLSVKVGDNLVTIDVDWAGIYTAEGNLVDGAVKMDISVFARVRF